MFKRKQKREERKAEAAADSAPEERHLVKKTLYVTGTGYYQDNMMKLAIPAPECFEDDKLITAKISIGYIEQS